MTTTSTTSINYHHRGDGEIKTEQPRWLTGCGVPTNMYAVDIGPMTIFATRDQITDLVATVASWEMS